MLKATVRNEHALLETWEFEGKLSGEWVKELNRCWLERPAQPGIRLQVDLGDVL